MQENCKTKACLDYSAVQEKTGQLCVMLPQKQRKDYRLRSVLEDSPRLREILGFSTPNTSRSKKGSQCWTT